MKKVKKNAFYQKIKKYTNLCVETNARQLVNF